MKPQARQENNELYEGKYRIKTARASWCNYNEGLYFVTICTTGKKHYFGEIVADEMYLTEMGKYTKYCIQQIEELHPNVTVPYSTVMPNHIHLIIAIASDSQLKGETPQCDVSTTNNNDLSNCDRETPQCDVSTTNNNDLSYCDRETPQCDVSTANDNDLSYCDRETPQCDVSTYSTKMRGTAFQCGKLSYLISNFKSIVNKYAKQNGIEFGWQSRFHDHIIRDSRDTHRIADYIMNNVYKWNTDCFNDEKISQSPL